MVYQKRHLLSLWIAIGDRSMSKNDLEQYRIALLSIVLYPTRIGS